MPELLQPRTLSQLTEALSTRGRLLVAAGGTDLLVRLRLHPSGEATVLDLSAMSDLRGVTEEGAFLRIGAMTTLTALNQCPLAQSRVPVLAAAAGMVGSTQIRNRATVGGNVANAAQCADTIPALIALEAEAELMNSAGALRRIPVADFVTGIGRTLITEHEVLTGFLIAPEMQGLRGGYGKIGSRKTVTIAKINGAAALRFEHGSIVSARVAFGSIGQRAFLSETVSAGLTGMSLDQLERSEYLELFVSQVDAAIPGRDSLPYKRSAVKAVAEAIILQAVPECRGCTS